MGTCTHIDVTVRVSVHVLEFYTPADYDLDLVGYVVASKTSLLFQVQTCKDAHIILSSNIGETLAYEVVLGGSSNTVSGIRTTRQQVRGARHCDVMI